MTALVNDLAGYEGELLLVLDDYHVITAPPVHEAVDFLLEHLPASVHLVLATRADPPRPSPAGSSEASERFADPGAADIPDPRETHGQSVQPGRAYLARSLRRNPSCLQIPGGHRTPR